MNFLDYFILAFLLWGFISGFRKGLISILCTLSGTIIGALAALKYMHPAGEYLVREFGFNEKFSDFAAFVAIFVGIYIVFFFLGKALSKAVSLVMLGFVNRFSGGIFGMLKFLLFISVIFSLSLHFGITLVDEELKSNSAVFSSVRTLSDLISPEADVLDLNQEAKKWIEKTIQ